MLGTIRGFFPWPPQLSLRLIYLLACVFNTIAIMSTCLMLVFVVLLPAATYVGRYHIMVIIILGAATLGMIRGFSSRPPPTWAATTSWSSLSWGPPRQV